MNSKTQEEEFANGGMQMAKMFSSAARRRSPPTCSRTLRTVSASDDHVRLRLCAASLGGVDVRMAVVGPTHTLGDTGFFVTGDNVLFSGDVVMNESFLVATPRSRAPARG